MPDEARDDLLQQRSMLVLLLAACRTAQTAFEAARNPLDAALGADLTKMIDRSQAELEKLEQRIKALA